MSLWTEQDDQMPLIKTFQTDQNIVTKTWLKDIKAWVSCMGQA